MRILQVETPTSSIEVPNTRTRSRNRKERQDQKKLLSQSNEFDEGREAFSMPESTNKNLGNQVMLKNVEEHQKE